MEKERLSLEEVIELAGKVWSWESLSNKDGESTTIYTSWPGHLCTKYESVSRTKSYRGLVENFEINISHQHCVANKSGPYVLTSYRHYRDSIFFKPELKHAWDQDNFFRASVSFGGIILGSYFSAEVKELLKNLYHSVEAIYGQRRQEQLEMAERAALEKARKLLG